MTLDLRRDAKELRALLTQRVDAFAEKAARSRRARRVSAVEVGFCLCQAGWVVVSFDTHPTHQRGNWCSFEERDVFERPQWEAAYEAVQNEPVSFVLPDGTRRTLPAGTPDGQFAAIFGRLIRDVLLAAKKDGLFERLPKADQCQLDVGEFNAMWSWPAYEEMGKTNLA